MGEYRGHHVLMFVTHIQEEVIRSVFRENNWHYYSKVLTEEDIYKLKTSGFGQLLLIDNSVERHPNPSVDVNTDQTSVFGPRIIPNLSSEILEEETVASITDNRYIDLSSPQFAKTHTNCITEKIASESCSKSLPSNILSRIDSVFTCGANETIHTAPLNDGISSLCSQYENRQALSSTIAQTNEQPVLNQVEEMCCNINSNIEINSDLTRQRELGNINSKPLSCLYENSHVLDSSDRNSDSINKGNSEQPSANRIACLGNGNIKENSSVLTKTDSFEQCHDNELPDNDDCLVVKKTDDKSPDNNDSNKTFTATPIDTITPAMLFSGISNLPANFDVSSSKLLAALAGSIRKGSGDNIKTSSEAKSTTITNISPAADVQKNSQESLSNQTIPPKKDSKETIPCKKAPAKEAVPCKTARSKETVPCKKVPAMETVPCKKAHSKETVPCKKARSKETVPCKKAPTKETVLHKVASKRKINQISKPETYTAADMIAMKKANGNQDNQSPKKERIKCVDCPKLFWSRSALWEHRNKMKHALPAVSPPTKLAQQIYSSEELAQLGYSKCYICGKSYPNLRCMKKHIKFVHNKEIPQYNCPICDEEFLRYDDLLQHKLDYQHNDNKSSLQNIPCDLCGRVLSTYASLVQHQKYACGKSEEEQELLRVHPCEVCGKKFKSPSFVKSHYKTVHVREPIICDICGTVCKNVKALHAHKTRHDESNKKFSCSECGKLFYSQFVLASHMRKHTKDKPFKCPLCDYVTGFKHNIQKHAKAVHKTKVTPEDLSKNMDTV